MVESKTARNARLRAMRQKYGLGEFKNRRTNPRRVQTMARRRFSSRVRRSLSSGGGMLKQASAGIGMAVLVQKFGGSMLGQYAGVASLGAAYYGGGAAGVVGALLTGTASLGGVLGGNGASSTPFYG